MTKINPSSIYLPPADLDRLQELATFCETYALRGAGMKAKRGSVSALCQALAGLPQERWQELKELLNSKPQK